MRKRRSLVAKRAAVLLCSLAIVAVGPSALQKAAAKDWPGQLGERKLHGCEYGFVYARQKSSVAQVRKVLAAVTKDMRQEGMSVPGAGFILVVDAKEKYPCETARLIAVLKEADPNVMTGEESGDSLKAITNGTEKARELGLDVSALLCLVPVPIHPRVLHKTIDGLPAGAEQQIGWGVVVSTDRCLKAAFKKTLDAALKKEKPGLAERVAIAAMMPLVERKAVAMMKKGRQAGLYTLFVNEQKDLSPEQKRRRVEAYKEKLGLNEQFDPQKDQDEPAETETDPPKSE